MKQCFHSGLLRQRKKAVRRSWSSSVTQLSDQLKQENTPRKLNDQNALSKTKTARSRPTTQWSRSTSPALVASKVEKKMRWGKRPKPLKVFLAVIAPM